MIGRDDEILVLISLSSSGVSGLSAQNADSPEPVQLDVDKDSDLALLDTLASAFIGGVCANALSSHISCADLHV